MPVLPLIPKSADPKDYKIEEIQEMLFLPFVEIGKQLLEKGIVADPRAIDIGAIWGIGFPADKGGPMINGVAAFHGSFDRSRIGDIARDDVLFGNPDLEGIEDPSHFVRVANKESDRMPRRQVRPYSMRTREAGSACHHYSHEAMLPC